MPDVGRHPTVRAQTHPGSTAVSGVRSTMRQPLDEDYDDCCSEDAVVGLQVSARYVSKRAIISRIRRVNERAERSGMVGSDHARPYSHPVSMTIRGRARRRGCSLRCCPPTTTHVSFESREGLPYSAMRYGHESRRAKTSTSSSSYITRRSAERCPAMAESPARQALRETRPDLRIVRHWRCSRCRARSDHPISARKGPPQI